MLFEKIKLSDGCGLESHDLLIEELFELFPADVVFVNCECRERRDRQSWTTRVQNKEQGTDDQTRKTRGRAGEQQAHHQGHAKMDEENTEIT